MWVTVTIKTKAVDKINDIGPDKFLSSPILT